MQIFAIVASLAFTVVAVAVVIPAVRQMLGRAAPGQPATPARTDRPARPHPDDAQGDVPPHPDAPVALGRDHALVVYLGFIGPQRSRC